MRHEYIVASKGRFITEGLTFNSEKHEYYYNGRSLSGITGLIGKTMKKNYSSGHVEEGRAQGSHVHSAIEDFVTRGTISSVHPDALWAINELKGFMDDGFGTYSEVLVSDFEKYASAIDLLLIRQDALYILDTKAGVFDRPYVTWQLSVYKYFLEEFAGLRVSGAYCLSTRHRDIYPIITRPVADVRELLYGRRA